MKTKKLGTKKNSLNYDKSIKIILLIGILVLFSIHVATIEKYPSVWIDEGWAAEPAYNLAFKGLFAMPSQTGWFGQGIATYSWPPITYLMIALSYVLFGFGIVQTRLVAHLALVILLITGYFFGKKITGKQETGLITVFLLLANHLIFYIYHSPRPDVFAGMFSFLGVYFYYLWKESKNKKNQERKLFTKENRFIGFSGLFFGLAVCSHAIGAISTIGVAILLLIQKKKSIQTRIRSMGIYIFGGLLSAIPYLLYILQHPKYFFLQYFSLHSSNFIQNILREYLRYVKVIERHWYFFLLAIIIGTIVLWKEKKTKELSYLILLNIIGLAILLPNKSASQYLITIIPLATVGIAILFAKFRIQKKIIRIGLLLILLGMLITGLGAQAYIIHQQKDYKAEQVFKELHPIIVNETIIAPLTYIYFFPEQIISVDNIRYQISHLNKTMDELVKEFNVKYILLDSQNPKKQDLLEDYLHNKTTKVKEFKEGYTIQLYKIEE